jgi:transcriptional regulator with XRE-family HTH domain
MVYQADNTVSIVDNGFKLSARELRKVNRDRGLLYRAVRKLLGLSQAEMARHIGCSRDAILAREYRRRSYSLVELNALQRASGLSDVEWCELLRQIAK